MAQSALTDRQQRDMKQRTCTNVCRFPLARAVAWRSSHSKLTPSEIQKAVQAQILHCTIVLKTNKMDFNGQDAYQSFKTHVGLDALF